MNSNVMLFRLVGMLVACLAGPALLCFYVGPAVGALGAVGAAAFWYSQYRLPSWKDGRDPNSWFVTSGYGIIGITLLVCLGRLLGVSL